MYEVGLNEPVLFFFLVPSGITKNTDVLVRLSGFKPVCLYSYHLFILLAVKTILYFGWRKRRFNEKNCSRINHHTEESRLKTK